MKKNLEPTHTWFDRRRLKNPMVGTSQEIGRFKGNDDKKNTYTQYQKERFLGEVDW